MAWRLRDAVAVHPRCHCKHGTECTHNQEDLPSQNAVPEIILAPQLPTETKASVQQNSTVFISWHDAFHVVFMFATTSHATIDKTLLPSSTEPLSFIQLRPHVVFPPSPYYGYALCSRLLAHPFLP
jgi:hypothetical protein